MQKKRDILLGLIIVAVLAIAFAVSSCSVPLHDESTCLERVEVARQDRDMCKELKGTATLDAQHCGVFSYMTLVKCEVK